MPTFSETSPHDYRIALNSVTACVSGVQSLIDAQSLFSFAVFGLPDFRGPAAVLDHVRKEVEEIALAPMDAQEWADLVLLALDGLQRACWLYNKRFPVGSQAEPKSPRITLTDKMRRNFNREWPALADQHPDRAVEHVRTPDEQAVKDAELPAGLGPVAPPLVRPEFTACPTYPSKGYDLEKCAAGVMAHFGLKDSEDLATAIQRHKSGGWAARDEAFRLHLTLNSAVQLAGYENLTHFTLSALANLGCIVPAEGDTL